MPSFDLVSKFDMGEMKNAVNMANKQIMSRYDFKGSNCSIEFKSDLELEIRAEDDYKLKTAYDMLLSNMAKRGLGLKGIDPKDPEPTGNRMIKQSIVLNSGIDKEKGKMINKLIKESGIKVSSQYLDEKIRVTGKKIDDLQQTFQMLKNSKDLTIELSMENMKS